MVSCLGCTCCVGGGGGGGGPGSGAIADGNGGCGRGCDGAAAVRAGPIRWKPDPANPSMPGLDKMASAASSSLNPRNWIKQTSCQCCSGLGDNSCASSLAGTRSRRSSPSLWNCIGISPSPVSSSEGYQANMTLSEYEPFMGGIHEKPLHIRMVTQ